jgi:hypothetical protein
MAARDGGTYLFVTIAADWRTGTVRDRHIIRTLARKPWDVCPVGVKSYFQA